jgi:hypothetical protein
MKRAGSPPTSPSGRRSDAAVGRHHRDFTGGFCAPSKVRTAPEPVHATGWLPEPFLGASRIRCR